ncbi:hypothetical protein BAE40_13295 [Mesorhizobium loti]|nr:hypothetical protein BAE40_13295 [Mesorhizobium loti]
MGISAKQIAHGDEDHVVRDVDALHVVAHEAPPSGHPAESSLDGPAAGEAFEALLSLDRRIACTTKSR